MKSNILTGVIIFLVSTISSFGQKEASIWYFGNGAGIDFSSGHPEALNNGMLYTNEGCATISDNKGALLFYTDGVKVWNKKHEQMPNGFGLGGSYSSTQSCQIVQKPGSNNLYYIFTVSDQATPQGFSYSIVDISLNKGNGDVILKNKVLLTPVSEKLTAVKHNNGKDFWIITHQWNSNAFYAYLLTSTGISNPFVSNTGVIHKDMGSGNKGESIGYLKASPDGKKLAVAINKMNTNNIEIFDFNNSSGIITHPISLTMGKSAYGITFSPNSTKVYVSSETGEDGIVQYDLRALIINQSAITVTPKNNTHYGALQIGPDEKIYIATDKPFLDVIENPNALGLACNYKADAVNLAGHYSAYGLPDFFIASSPETPQEKSNPIADNSINICKVNLGNDTSLYCEKDLLLTVNVPEATYLWSTGTTNNTIKAIYSGTYRVTVTKKNCSFTDSINIVFKGKPTSFICLKEFTPNNDGVNDIFDFIINDIKEFELSVYNSRGKLVYQSNDQKQKWDGKHNNKYASNGVYSWVVKYKSSCPGKETVTQKGEVNLVR